MTGSDITASLTVGSSTLTMVISAYGPNGAAEQRNCATLSAAGPIQPVNELSEAIDNIASELRDEFSTSNPFLHGVWSITGVAEAGPRGEWLVCSATEEDAA